MHVSVQGPGARSGARSQGVRREACLEAGFEGGGAVAEAGVARALELLAAAIAAAIRAGSSQTLLNKNN